MKLQLSGQPMNSRKVSSLEPHLKRFVAHLYAWSDGAIVSRLLRVIDRELWDPGLTCRSTLIKCTRLRAVSDPVMSIPRTVVACTKTKMTGTALALSF